MENIKKVQFPKKSGLLIKHVGKTIKSEVKEKNVDFLACYRYLR